MSAAGDALGDAIKAAMDAQATPIDRTDMFRAMGNAILTGAILSGVSIQTYTASGSYSKPAGLVAALVLVQGGGAGGGGGNAQSTSGTIVSGGGGAAGGFGVALVQAASFDTTETVTIGAGGVGGVNSGGAGGAGGASSLTLSGSTLSAGGGGAGGGGVGTGQVFGAINTGGTCSGPFAFSMTGGTGGRGIQDFATNCHGGMGAPSFWGTGGRGGFNLGAGVDAGRDAQGYGAGGGGGAATNNVSGSVGGAGGGGLIVIIEFKKA